MDLLAAGPDGTAPVFGQAFEGDESRALLWVNGEAYYEWTFSIQNSGLYYIEVEYALAGEKTSNVQRTLRLDGEIPFTDASGILFHGLYQEEGDVTVNAAGDEVRPRLTAVRAYTAYKLESPRALYVDPFRFLLDEGEHTLRLDYVEGGMAIRSLTLIPVKEQLPYAALREKYQASPYMGEQVTLQAEEAGMRNDEVLRREYNSDPTCEPFKFGYRVLNVIGDARFKQGGQTITWEIDVPETGLYKIGMRVLQNWNDGLPAVRRITIDGEVPFREMAAYHFPYDANWQTVSLQDENGEDYLFYLEKGLHTLGMTVVLGYAGEAVLKLEDTVSRMMQFYREIKMVTGPKPDVYYDYQFERVVPDLDDKLSAIESGLTDVMETLQTVARKNTSMGSNFERARDIVRAMRADPYQIARRLDSLYDTATDIGTWITQLSEQPLTLDTIMLAAPSKSYEVKKAGLFDSVKAFAMSFILSFIKDYDSVGSTGAGGQTLEVWVSRNAEWAEVMKDQAEEQFTPQENISLKINVVPAGQLNTGVNVLLLSVISGTAPDVIVGVDQNTPVEFAIRNAVVDLRGFDGFEEVCSRFYPAAFTPVTYGNGIYALPETMDFMILLYRTDIFQELNLQVPRTWNDMYTKVLPVLKQNNMDFFFASGLNLFMFQQGADFYTEDGRYAAVDSEASYRAFSQWTSLYTDYDIPVTANFFNRFRSGEIPLGITGFSDYILLKSAAPELYGKWKAASVPIQEETGETGKATGKIAATYLSILESSEKKEAAWKLLDWWTSTQAQSTYARTVESMFGVEGRYASANKEAFELLPWGEDLPVIRSALENAQERRAVLGGYYTERHVVNAQNRVIIDGMKPRDSLRIMKKDIDRELLSKRKEFGLE